MFFKGSGFRNVWPSSMQMKAFFFIYDEREALENSPTYLPYDFSDFLLFYHDNFLSKFLFKLTTYTSIANFDYFI